MEDSCALAGGGLTCFGKSSYGELGIGIYQMPPRLSPVQVTAVSAVTALAVGGNHTCAIAQGSPVCWGWNQFGNLGDGTTIDRPLPVPVQGL
jgi:alpha-tubulin suppressor-like RCC1 family protein